MGEIGSFYCSEEQLEIPNRNLECLILKDIEAKTANPFFVTKEGNEVQFPTSKTSIHGLESYRKAIIAWGGDPVNPPNGIDGHGYSLMLTEVLRHVLRDRRDLIVRQTPATLDFIDRTDIERYGPSSDIFIGTLSKDGNSINPLVLIDAVTGDGHAKIIKNRILGVPIICLPGNKLFRNGKDAVFSFGMSSSPVDYAQSLAQAAGPKILQRLEVR